MTISPAPPAPTRSRHWHSKSSPAIHTVTSLHLRGFQPRFHAPSQLSTPRNNQGSPHTPQTDTGSSKKKRRSRKSKENIKPTSIQSSEIIFEKEVARKAPPHPIMTDHTTPTNPVDSPGKAYAGPTFHHSPAPSSLPVPKFFSKSVPTRSRPNGLQAMLEEDDDRTDDSGVSSPTYDGNPLEKLFKADQEERALRNRQLSDNSDCDSTSDPNSRDVFGMDTDSPVKTLFKTPRRTHVRNFNGSESIFSMDSFSVPSSPAPPMSPLNDESQRWARSDALKKFLLQDKSISSPSRPTFSPPARLQTLVSPQGSPIPLRYKARRYDSNNPLLNSPPKGPQFRPFQNGLPLSKDLISQQQLSTIFDSRADAMTCKPNSCDFTDMENSLRQILRLDPRPVATGGVMI